MEKEYQISWLKIVGITALIAVIIVIICLVYPKKDNTLLTQQTYISNITLMKDAGFEYFTGSNLPQEIGDKSRITLDEMLARNLVVEFVDEEGNSCDTKNSYIEATKTMDNEYEMSIYLACDNKSDYIITSISNEVVCTDCNTITTEDENDNNELIGDSGIDTDSSSNIKPTYPVNGGSNNSSTSGQTINVTQNTNININYVNTCCTDGNSSNCSDNCLANVYHSVVFDSTGGSLVRTQIVKHGGYAFYVEPYRYGYDFLGWYLNGEKYDFNTPVTEKITLYAKWKKKDTEEDKKEYIVDFDSNGGSYVEPEEVQEGDTVTRPTDPTKKCYDFAGWYQDSELTIAYDFDTPVTSDMTLYAKWVDNGTCQEEIHQVEFDTNGGGYIKPQEVVDGDVATRPTDPVKKCYEFVGWYTDSKLTHRYDFSTPVTEDITLYAKWRDDGSCTQTYTVSFDSNGGSRVRSQTVEEGSRADEPNDPTRSGYEFVGWYLDERKFSFSTRIYEDITLEAKWEKEEEKYNTYCKVEDETHYSISYTTEKQNKTYSWQIRFDDLENVQDVRITDVNYLTTTNMYNNAYRYTYNKGISMVGGINNYIYVTSGSMLRSHSLKSSNFVPNVSSAYYSSGDWYTDVTVRVKNFNNVSPYYASNIGSQIYFVPFYFTIQYTDLDNCVDDKASNSYKYDDYKIVDTYWK